MKTLIIVIITLLSTIGIGFILWVWFMLKLFTPNYRVTRSKVEFNPNVIEMFMFKYEAYIYSYLAKTHGYIPTISGPFDNWIELGGRWSVTLTMSGGQ